MVRLWEEKAGEDGLGHKVVLLLLFKFEPAWHTHCSSPWSVPGSTWGSKPPVHYSFLNSSSSLNGGGGGLSSLEQHIAAAMEAMPIFSSAKSQQAGYSFLCAQGRQSFQASSLGSGGLRCSSLGSRGRSKQAAFATRPDWSKWLSICRWFPYRSAPAFYFFSFFAFEASSCAMRPRIEDRAGCLRLFEALKGWRQQEKQLERPLACLLGYSTSTA